ncbi:hypothetical protein BG005_000298 [Podila minutissima]|nr:hypothetical protein BG005_000298 [Podila minutissima]
MDVYSLTKKQRPTQLTRGEIDKNTTTTTMTQPQHSQLPPQYRQALLEQQQRQQQQQQQQPQQPQVNPAPPTLQEIETKHSQLPPQYRQAVLEQQQREHQMRLLQQQQGQQPQQNSPKMDSPRLQSSSPASSPTGSGSTAKRSTASHQRILSAPHMHSHRPRDGDANQGPSRAHWKPDNSAHECTWPGCHQEFGFFDRRHHCRRCGEIFCSAHCSKTIPLDHALDFNPAMGVNSRACIGCFEEYEQWQGLVPTSLALSSSTYTNSNIQNTRGAIGSVSESNLGSYTSDKGNSDGRKNTGHIPEGLLGQNGSSSSGETLGREDIVRLPKSTSDNIAIKSRPAQDQTVMPMPSVPHDWSWSTF